MANAYVIWDQNSKSFVGGATPLLFSVSADATAQLNSLYAATQRHEKQPKPSFSVITVTVP